MTTPPSDKQVVQGETLEEIAERIANSFRKQLGFSLNAIVELNDAILLVLRNERERGAWKAEDHRHVSACDGAGCKTVIAAAIRKGR